MEGERIHYRQRLSAKIQQFPGGPIQLIEEVLALYYCAVDRRTPSWAKAIALSAVAYFLIPADMIPDGIPVCGLVDDAGVVSAAVAQLYFAITQEHRRRATSTLRVGREYKPAR